MTEYRVEYDVSHAQYVLHLDGETILLGKQNIREANWYALMIVDGRKNRDSSSSDSNTTDN